MKRFAEFIQTSVWVFRLYWRISPTLILTVLLTQILLQLQTLVYAYVFGLAIDRVIGLIDNKLVGPKEMLPILVLFVGIYIASNFIQLVNNRALNILGNKDGWYLRKFLYEHLATLGVAKLEDPDLTNKTTRFNEMLGSLNQHMQILAGLLSLIVTLITSGIVVSAAVPFLTPVFIIFFILKFAVNQRYIGLLWSFNRRTTEDRRKATTTASMLSNPNDLKEIIVTQAADYLESKYMFFVKWATGEFSKLNLAWFRLELLQNIGDTILYAIGLYFVITNGIREALTIGAITFLIRSVSTFYDHLDSLSYRIARARESAIRLKDAQELFDKYLPEEDGVHQLVDHGKVPSIEFRNVTFSYPHSPRPIFKNLNLTIGSEEKIAIVGINGAGKTTLVKLLARLYKISEGEILIDGININELNINSWYKKLGVLFQDFNTYGHLTVQENVGLGRIQKRGISEKHVKRALHAAEAMDFVEAYPKKLDQILSERYKEGIRPSTGQWQKIAIARFFYRKSPVLILDEPTASIDAVAEAGIFDNIYKFIKHKTVIIISHRFSTVRNADRIIVLHEGKIVEEGSHDQLLKKKGKYAKAFKLQAKGYE